ncbi:sarcosine oxidase subunit beta family protein [Thalassotalea nanhaiensis]|uniref:Sarcosine oxidase subunit beta n=1 Tax=Thalassotalea nanhaiensis TaxID=3065648 RepID=A0ABY9TDT0_9GAMM|nr:sarcosine oxidase subunit beta family protein [Colwelliaceae bacterium SQ345]
MEKYSFTNLAKHALAGHKNWKPLWRSPEPKKSYDVVIVGAGGQGLATAYYLAKNHGITNVAVIDKGWLGGGNTGRNTSMVRSNYFYEESSNFYDHSLKLYEQLGNELNYNVMLSQGGVMLLGHSAVEMQLIERAANSLLLQGVDSEMLTPEQVKEREPVIDLNPNGRYPIQGGFVQKRGGVARHDAVAWGYARRASDMGVDIIQDCPITNILTDSNNKAIGVETAKFGVIKADKVVSCVAGLSSTIADMAGFDLPIKSQTLQAMVSEPIKPVMHGCVGSGPVHCYVSQSDRGEILVGGTADFYPSFGQRGNINPTEHTLAAMCEIFPLFSRLKLMRQWAGIVDISPDSTPIIGLTPVKDMYISTGWGTGGFKGIPAGGETLAYTVANNKPHHLVEKFDLGRFARGEMIDEAAAAGIPH